MTPLEAGVLNAELCCLQRGESVLEGKSFGYQIIDTGPTADEITGQEAVGSNACRVQVGAFQEKKIVSGSVPHPSAFRLPFTPDMLCSAFPFGISALSFLTPGIPKSGAYGISQQFQLASLTLLLNN